MNEDELEALVSLVARRVEARLAAEQKSAPPVTASSYGSSTILPCAIPPPGSPRYAEVMRALEENEGGMTSAPARSEISPGELAARIEHTLLKPDATPREIERLCHEALQWGFAAVCVNPSHVPQCAGLLQGSAVRVCTVVGFPLGAMTTEAKAFETRDAVSKGADEIDMVISVGRLKAGDHAYVEKDIRAVVQAAQGRPVKVILETSMLTEEEKRAACALARSAGAKFVKTSTGFGGAGATLEDVALLRECAGAQLGVKAAGGIRDTATALAMARAGADRIGTSSGVAILRR